MHGESSTRVLIWGEHADILSHTNEHLNKKKCVDQTCRKSLASPVRCSGLNSLEIFSNSSKCLFSDGGHNTNAAQLIIHVTNDIDLLTNSIIMLFIVGQRSHLYKQFHI